MAEANRTTPNFAAKFWQLMSLAEAGAAAVHASDHADAMVSITNCFDGLASLAERFAQEANEAEAIDMTVTASKPVHSDTTITRRPMTDDQVFIEGAKQAMDTLRNIDAWGEAQGEDMTFDQYRARQDAVIDAAMAPLHGLSARQRGYVRVLVEALEFHRRVGAPNVDHDGGWIPAAMMSAEELAKKRAEYRKDWEE